MSFTYTRVARTAASEKYYVRHSDISFFAAVDLHYTDVVYGSIFIEKDRYPGEEFLEEFIRNLEEDIISTITPREDFIFSVNIGEEQGFYSDIVDHDESKVASKVDFDKLDRKLSAVLNKHAVAKGQLTEHTVREYFEELGYESKRADSEMDHKKIDVISENDCSIIYTQVKHGKVRVKDIYSLVESVKTINCQKNKIACVVAETFPNSSERVRIELTQSENIDIMYLHKYQILDIVKSAKRVIG